MLPNSKVSPRAHQVKEVEYRLIACWPGYRVGDDGSVWSQRLGGWRPTNPWVRMIGGVDRRGYPKITLCRNGVQTSKRICILVLESFRGPKPDGMECCHERNDVSNNHLGNLRWDTHRSNMADKIRHGTSQHGARNGRAKLTDQTVREIRRRWAAGESQLSIAADLNIKPVTLNAAIHRNWRHVS